MTLQAITDGGAISADWTLVGAFIFIGFLLLVFVRVGVNHLVDTLTKLTNRIENHDSRINSLEKNEALQDSHIKTMLDEKEAIFDKVRDKWGLAK